jgi:hypothetical protein
MKETSNQIKLAKEISDYILSLVTTNDLHSPSNWNLNREYADKIAEGYFDEHKLGIPDKNNPEAYLAEGIKETFDWAITTIRRVK